jgi:hypothetical protein
LRSKDVFESGGDPLSRQESQKDGDISDIDEDDEDDAFDSAQSDPNDISANEGMDILDDIDQHDTIIPTRYAEDDDEDPIDLGPRLSIARNMEEYKRLNTFIEDLGKQEVDKYKAENVLMDHELPTSQRASDDPYNSNQRAIVKYRNHDDMVREYNEGYSNCNAEQRHAIDLVKQTIDVPRNLSIQERIDNQLIMFMSGEGGTGKSSVIKLIGLLCKVLKYFLNTRFLSKLHTHISTIIYLKYHFSYIPYISITYTSYPDILWKDKRFL